MTGSPLGPALRRRPPIHAPSPERIAVSRADSRRRQLVRWGLASLLLHVALLLGWLLPDLRRDMPEPLPPPAIEVVLEGGAPDRPAQQPAVPAPPTPPDQPAPPTPPSVAAPPPAPPPPPPPAPMPAPAPVPPAPTVAPAESAPISPPPPPPPPAPLPAPAPVPATPAPRQAAALPEAAPPPPPLPAPPPEASAALPPPPPGPPPEAEAPAVEIPPFALPSPQPLALPTRPRPPAAAPPAARPPPIARSGPNAPVFLPDSFAFERQRPPAARSPRAPLDTAIGPEQLGRLTPDPTLNVRGAEVGPDWRNAFRAWLDQHLRYPELARLNGEDGVVQVRITANPDGTVRSVRLLRGSGSTWLDRGTQQPFRTGVQLPRFPPGADPSGVTIDLQVTYSLIRR